MFQCEVVLHQLPLHFPENNNILQLADQQAYYGAHGHADGMWMAAEDLHYYDDARERVMVYPGARSSLPDGTTAVLLLAA